MRFELWARLYALPSMSKLGELASAEACQPYYGIKDARQSTNTRLVACKACDTKRNNLVHVSSHCQACHSLTRALLAFTTLAYTQKWLLNQSQQP